jgi:peptidoglycan hydrolase-like protein with peptidoglycan-binding domain
MATCTVCNKAFGGMLGNLYDLQKLSPNTELKVGGVGTHVKDLKGFLARFGYLDKSLRERENVFGAGTQAALKRYQAFHGLEQSGVLDTATSKSMSQARCAFPDRMNPLAFSALGAWNRRNLRYAFGAMSADVTADTARNAVRRAFASWSNAGSGLSFAEVAATDAHDIFIDWRSANDPDLSMVGSVLAHADYPPGFSVVVANPPLPLHFDDSEHTWVDGAVSDAFDIETVALHEIGHLLGLAHSNVSGSVMFPSVGSNMTNRVLQQDDLDGIHRLYSETGWRRFELSGDGSASAHGGIASVSRIPNSMEMWWIGGDGAVRDAFWYEGANWQRFDLAAPGSASTSAGIAAVSRIPNSMEVWWIGANGSVQDAYWYDGAPWQRFELAPAGSASVTGGITAVSRAPGTMEIWWIAANGSVQAAYWYDGHPWQRYELAGPGSASTSGGITAVSRIAGSMEVWWIGSNGSVQAGYWYEGSHWQRYELAPPGSASVTGGITAVSRIPNSMEVWWIGANGSVQDGYWYEGGHWQRFELAPAGSASLGAGIASVSRIPQSMEIWWIGANGSIQDAYWYEGANWQRFELAGAGSASPNGGVSAVSRIEDSMEIWWTGSNGSVQDNFWYA